MKFQANYIQCSEKGKKTDIITFKSKNYWLEIPLRNTSKFQANIARNTTFEGNWGHICVHFESKMAKSNYFQGFHFCQSVAMISNFSYKFYYQQTFSRIFFHKCNILLHLDMILVIFLLTVVFFSFQSQLYFSPVLLKINKIFLYNLPQDIKYACFFYVIKCPNR